MEGGVHYMCRHGRACPGHPRLACGGALGLVGRNSEAYCAVGPCAEIGGLRCANPPYGLPTKTAQVGPVKRWV
jgi:hypothetical protein